MSRLRASPLADVPAAPVAWLWPPYLARGKLATLDGDPGSGKTLLAVDLAARLTRGGPLPDGQPLDRPGTALLLTAGDDPADTLRPRADAAGADLARLIVAAPGPDGPVRLPGDLPALEELIYAHCPDLLVLDPLAAFVGPAASSHESSVRRALGPLAALAAQTGCAVLLLRSLNKAGGPQSLYRGLGSIGIAGSIATGLLVARHPDDPDLRVLALAKSNLGPAAPAVGFRVAADPHGRAAVTWAGPIDLTADELCAAPPTPTNRRPRERAVEWLRDQLAGGPRKAADLTAAAVAVGIPERTLDRAKKALGVEAKRVHQEGHAEWIWSDPAAPSPSSDRFKLPPLPDLDFLDGFPRPRREAGR